MPEFLQTPPLPPRISNRSDPATRQSLYFFVRSFSPPPTTIGETRGQFPDGHGVSRGDNERSSLRSSLLQNVAHTVPAVLINGMLRNHSLGLSNLPGRVTTDRLGHHHYEFRWRETMHGWS
jgi:hypothetical protein